MMEQGRKLGMISGKFSLLEFEQLVWRMSLSPETPRRRAFRFKV